MFIQIFVLFFLLAIERSEAKKTTFFTPIENLTNWFLAHREKMRETMSNIEVSKRSLLGKIYG